MSEGAQLPWKVQRIDTSRGPPAEYSSLLRPLPGPPRGTEWQKDRKTGEWKLVPQGVEEKTGRITETDRSDDAVETRRTFRDHEQGQEQEISREANTIVVVEKKESALEGVDYLVHTVLPTDTLQGICLSYKIAATRLRQANKFSGSNLLLAPAKLIIPLADEAHRDKVRIQDHDSPEYKIHSFLAEFPDMRPSEARAYLELSDWNLEDALDNAKDDTLWERMHRHESAETSCAATHLSPKKNDNEDCVTLDVHVAIPATRETKGGDGRSHSVVPSALEMKPLLATHRLNPAR